MAPFLGGMRAHPSGIGVGRPDDMLMFRWPLVGGELFSFTRVAAIKSLCANEQGTPGLADAWSDNCS